MQLEQSLPALDAGERFLVRPEWRERLAAEGLTTCAGFQAIEGPIISGHPGRHVLRIQIGDETCYLKREHAVTWRERLSSWLAGWGYCSVSRREALTLDEVRSHGIDAPEWIACGESPDGRAFLLLRGLPDVESLRERLERGAERTVGERRVLARRLARRIAAIHDAGFAYPDLYAKHVLVDPAGEGFTFLDWQRSARPRRIGWTQRCRDLAALHASLPVELADNDVRLTFLLAYYRAAKDQSLDFGRVCRRIHRRTEVLLQRGSLREQRLARQGESQPLYWIRGEELCLSEMGRTMLDPEEIQQSVSMRIDRGGCADLPITIGGNRCQLTVRRTMRRFGVMMDSIRGRRWQAPESRQAANLLRCERLGETPRLLAFGQRTASHGVVDSFLLCLPSSPLEAAS